MVLGEKGVKDEAENVEEGLVGRRRGRRAKVVVVSEFVGCGTRTVGKNRGKRVKLGRGDAVPICFSRTLSRLPSQEKGTPNTPAPGNDGSGAA
jgi:hypothetical protein